MTYATTNPYTGETVATFPFATDAEVDRAIETAHAVFLEWRETNFSTRAAVMHVRQTSCVATSTTMPAF